MSGSWGANFTIDASAQCVKKRVSTAFGAAGITRRIVIGKPGRPRGSLRLREPGRLRDLLAWGGLGRLIGDACVEFVAPAARSG